MKRDAAQYAILTHLLDDALALDEAARAHWLETLPAEFADQRAALARMLTFDRRASNRTLLTLEGHLRSGARGVDVLFKLLEAGVPPTVDC
jgi:hypothetical protein